MNTGLKSSSFKIPYLELKLCNTTTFEFFAQIKIFALVIRKLNGQDEMNDYENN